MSKPYTGEYTRTEIYELLKELANALYKRAHKGDNATIYICGGAAIMLMLNSRDTTQDIDADWEDDRTIRECINKVADKNNIDHKWCNKDFKKSTSYTPMIYEYSRLFKQFRGLTVYLVEPILLLCMKLISFRTAPGKHDMDDISALLFFLRNNNMIINAQVIHNYMVKFYGVNYKERLCEEAIIFIRGL